jgi:hypothetical protein
MDLFGCVSDSKAEWAARRIGLVEAGVKLVMAFVEQNERSLNRKERSFCCQ